MGERELPVGWESVTIGDIATIEKNVATPDDLKGNSQKFIGLENIEKDSGRLVNFSEISGDELRSTKFKFTPEHILYGKLRPYLNKVFLPDFEGVCSTDILTIKPHSKRVVRKFLELVLKRTDFVDYATTRSIGANLPRVSPSTVLDYSFALPPLPVQCQISDVFEQAEAMKRQRHEANALTGALLQSVFLERFGYPARNEKGWEVKRLKEVCKTTSGGTPSRANPRFFEGNIPWLKSGELESSNILTTQEKISQEAIDNSATKIIPKGTVLIALYGATVGKVGILGIDAAINQAICAIFIEKEITSSYLYYFLIQSRQNLMSKRAGGAQPNISQEIINNLEIPLPPLALQQQFANIVESVERIREQQVASGKEIEGLCEGLMARVFVGELIG